MKKLQVVAMTSIVMLAAGFGVIAQQASATIVERCGEKIDERPVVVVIHGLWGSPAAWNEPGLTGSMNDSIKLVHGANLVEPFNYENYNSKWVTDPHIGQALAGRINCLSAASKEAGGNGRVVVVAHSMGGLALREALNRANPVYVKPENVGLAVMIGTPHNGAPVAKWCNPVGCGQLQPAVAAMRPGSQELQTLPKLPPTVPLRAIAGRIIGYNGYGTDDGVVPVASATGRYTRNYPGDGRFEMSCLQLWPWQKPSCHHERQLKDPGVQALVIQALVEYVRSQPSPNPTPSSTVSTCPPTTEPTPQPSATLGEPSAGATPTEPEGEIGGVGGGEPSATPAEPSPTVVPSEPACA